MSGARAYYPALDGLRAIAFLLVFSQHYVQLPWGWTGVEIFFVLSGFLITGILYDTRDAQHRFKYFYIRRSLRILPLFYFVLVVVTVFGLLVHSRMSWGWLAWFFYFGNILPFLHQAAPQSAFGLTSLGTVLSPTHNWLAMSVRHFWSLCIEEQFYLLWPAVVYGIRAGDIW